MPGGRPGYADTEPPGHDNIANAQPLGLIMWVNAPRFPVGMGTIRIEGPVNPVTDGKKKQKSGHIDGVADLHV